MTLALVVHAVPCKLFASMTIIIMIIVFINDKD